MMKEEQINKKSKKKKIEEVCLDLKKTTQFQLLPLGVDSNLRALLLSSQRAHAYMHFGLFISDFSLFSRFIYLSHAYRNQHTHKEHTHFAFSSYKTHALSLFFFYKFIFFYICAGSAQPLIGTEWNKRRVAPFTCLYVVCACMYTHIYICRHIYVYIYIYIAEEEFIPSLLKERKRCINICTYIYVHICVYMYTYIYIYI